MEGEHTMSTVQVAVDNATFHFDKLYTYRLPARLEGKVFEGSMVLVPFGRGDKPRMAVVLALGGEEPEESLPAESLALAAAQTAPPPRRAPRLKEVFDAAPEEARLTPDLLKLVHFLKERTFCTFYEAVRAIIPYGAQYRPQTVDGKPGLRRQLLHQELRYRRTAYPAEAAGRITDKQRTALNLLAGGGPQTAAQLEAQGVSRAVLEALIKKGLAEKHLEHRDAGLYDAPAGEPAQVPALTPEQQGAFEQLEPRIGDGAPHAALLYGVTGSGKTLVFLKLIRRTLELGRQALVLVPEIGLTPQMIHRLKSIFGSRVAVQHSALSNTERLEQWRMIQQGGADIVVGTRSAVFAPLQNLGLIILDEEQEHTYRSESSPRYAAHDVAKQRAAQHNALLLFASATPSVETYQAAQSGRYQLVRLAHRYEGRPLPTVELVDMRAEIAKGNPGEISLPLAKAIGENLEAGRQTILLLNRRGYRTVAQCGDCGHVVKCGGCSVPMVYHKAKGQLLCHYCGRTISPPPTVCPECGGPLRYTGFGTQKLEEELGGLFPTARILRMDQDTTGQKNAHEERLAKFAAHEYDIMLGTQMVAKGLDFEKVTLVGVVGIDSMLFSQSFRAFETAFSLVTQVVGRGGRADMPGHAIIQTSDPEHPVLRLAAKQDYDSFFEQEIVFRKLGLYPPFCGICVVGFSGGEDAVTLAAAGRFAALLREEAGAQPELPLRVLGPAPMNVLMVNGRYRYKLTLKCRNDRAFRAMLGRVLGRYSEEGLPARAAVTVDLNSDGDL